MRREPAWVLLACVAGAVLVNLPLLLRPGDVWVDDLTRTYLPWIGFATERLTDGRPPLWNPYSFAGMPFYTNPETALYYPFHLLLFPLLPFKPALLGVRVLDMAVAAAGLFGLLRRAGLGRAAAGFGGGVFALGGYFQFQFVHLPYVNTLAWLPVALLGVERVLERPTVGRAAALAAVWAVQLTGGSSEVFLHANVFVLLYTGFRLGSDPGLRGRDGLARRVALLALALAGFVGLGAIALLPTLEFIGHSLRSTGVDLETLRRGMPSPSLLEHSVFPWWLYRRGAPFSHTILFEHTGHVATYVGTVPLLLAAVGVVAGRPARLAGFLFAVALASLWLARAPESAAYATVVSAIPPLGWFRWSHNFLVLYAVAVPMLAAIGLEAVLADARRGARLLLLLAAALAGIAFAVGAVPADGLAAAGALAGAVLLGVAAPARSLPRVALGAVLVLATAADLVLFGSRLLPLSAPGYQGFEGDRALIATLEERGDERRVSVLGEAFHQLQVSLDDPLYAPRLPVAAQPLADTPAWFAAEARRMARFGWLADGAVSPDPEHRSSFEEAYPINLSMIEGYRELGGYDVFRMGRFDELVAALDSLSLLRQMSVAYVVSSAPLVHPELSPVWSDGRAHLHEVRGALPRAYLVCRAEREPAGEALLARLARDDHDPARVLLLESEADPEHPHALPGCVDGAAGDARIEEDGENEVVVRTAARAATWLVLNDPHYPGWRAEVDGEPVPIRRANHLFRAVALGPGEHEVRFRFRPESLALGVATTAGTALALALLAALAAVRARRRVSP